MPDDMTLQAMVMDELAWTPNVDAAHIGVAAQNGVVTLSGHRQQPGGEGCGRTGCPTGQRRPGDRTEDCRSTAHSASAH